MGKSQFRTPAGNNALKPHLGGNKFNIQNHKRHYIYHFKISRRLLSIMILRIHRNIAKWNILNTEGYRQSVSTLREGKRRLKFLLE